MTDKNSVLHLEISRADKARWVRAAQEKGMKLADFVVETLNREAERIEKSQPRPDNEQ